MKRIIAILLAAVLALSLAACGGSGIDISQPEHLATFDEPSFLTEDNGAVHFETVIREAEGFVYSVCRWKADLP